MRSPSQRLLIGALAIVLVATACRSSGGDGPEPAGRLVVLAHDFFLVSDEVIASFESATNSEVQLLQAGDAGVILSQAILTKDNPVADVIFGVDNTFLSRAVTAEITRPYVSPGLTDVPAELQLDPTNRFTPIDFGDVCLNYDRAVFEPGDGEPTSLDDLTGATFAGTLVTQDPSVSSPGLAFLLATIARYGDGWPDYWRQLRDNDVLVVSDWGDAYYNQFSGASDGDRPVVVSYASSPPAGLLGVEPLPAEAPTAIIEDSCFRQVEFAGVLEGAANPELAEQFIDFMLTVEFQEDIPLNMFVFPANQNAALPELFANYTTVVDEPLTLAPEQIEQNREAWIEEWTDIVLR